MQTSKRFQRWVRQYGVAALAEALGISHQAVSQWALGETVPAPRHYAKLAVLGKRAPWSFADLLPR